MFRHKTVLCCAYIFFLNGIFYYFFPMQHYLLGGTGGWIQYIKYLTFIPILLISLSILPEIERNYQWYLVFVVILTLSLFSLFYWLDEGNVLLFQLITPLLTYLLGGGVNKLKIGLKDYFIFYWFLIFITSILTLSELYFNFFNGLYSSSGFRAIGPFVNPNNTGLVVAFFSVAYFILEDNKIKSLLSLFVALLIIVLTGSKTALFVYVLALFFSVSALYKILLGLTSLAIGLFYIMWQQILSANVRDFSFESAYIRIKTITDIFHFYGDGIENILFGISNASLVDCAYLDILFFSGFFVFFIFILIQLLAFIKCLKAKNKVLIVCHLMFIMMMLTTNVPRLWPLAYIYWIIISYSFFVKSEQKSI